MALAESAYRMARSGNEQPFSFSFPAIMNNYKDHTLAALLPMMSQTEIAELAGDIKENGLRAPITLYEGKVLDGRNRYRACKIAGVEPRFRQLNGDDPLAFIVSANVRRRHLNESQRAIIAAKLVTTQHGGKRQEANWPLAISTGEAAEKLNVSPRTVKRAKKILQEAPPEKVKAIESGEKTVHKVLKEIKPPPQLDGTGYPIPESILSDWREAEAFNDTIKQLHRVKLCVEKALEDGNLAFREVTNTTTAELKNAWGGLQRVIPYAVCPTCQGQTRSKCTLCKQRGFISKFAWEHWTTKETRELRARLAAKKQ